MPALAVPSTLPVRGLLTHRHRALLALAANDGRLDGGQLTRVLDAALGTLPRQMETAGLVRCLGEVPGRTGGRSALLWELTDAGWVAARELRAGIWARRAARVARFAESLCAAPARSALPAARRRPSDAPAEDELGWRDLVALCVRLAGLPVVMWLGAHRDDPARATIGRLRRDTSGIDVYLFGPLTVNQRGPLLQLSVEGAEIEQLALTRPLVRRARVQRNRSFPGDHALEITTGHGTVEIELSDAVPDVAWLADEYYDAPVSPGLLDVVSAADPLGLTRAELLQAPMTVWPVPEPKDGLPWAVADWQPDPDARPGRPLHQRRVIELGPVCD